MKSNILFAFFIFILSIILTHVIYSLLLSIYATESFTTRGPNIRYFTKKEYQLTSAYMKSRISNSSKNKKIIVAGSSVSWGYPMNASRSLAGVLEKQSSNFYKVADASIIGASLYDTNKVIREIYLNKISVDFVIIEIPIINEIVASNFEDFVISNIINEKIDQDQFSSIPNTYFSFFLNNPYGLKYFVLLRHSFVDRLGERSLKKIKKIPKHYILDSKLIEERKEILQNKIKKTIMNALKIAKVPVLFFSPIYRQAYKDLSIDDTYIEKYIEYALDACLSFNNVICNKPFLDVEANKSNFYNITHVNNQGINKVAKILLNSISP